MAKLPRKSSGRSQGRSSDKSGKSNYKAKRSFSNNKEFRKKREDDPDSRERRSYGDPAKKNDRFRDRPYKKAPLRGAGGDKESRGERDPEKRERAGSRGERRDFREKRDSAGSDRPYKKKEFKRTGEGSSRDPEKYSEKRRSSSERGGKEDRRSPVTHDRPYKKEPYKKASEKRDSASRDSGRGSAEKTTRSGEGADKRRSGSSDRAYKAGTSKSSFGKRESEFKEKRVRLGDFEEDKDYREKRRSEISEKPVRKKAKTETPGLVRLNKYLANAGIASRREADTLISSGVVKVNGQVVTEMGFKVKPGDTVTYGDQSVKGERKVYILLNKPKDYITTVDDPQERKTVMHLIEGACRERVYPVGRLDRNTTGLLLFTNDGELTKKLTHPKHNVRKVYHVSLNKGLKPEHFKEIAEGIELEDGFIKADDLSFVGEGKKEIGIEIHSGRNRIVRRIFEHLGYDVLKLDRVVFAGLTKKDLPRGKYRFLTQKEVNFLQMVG